MKIQKCTVADVIEAPAFGALAAEYAAESAIDGLPPPHAKLETYPRLEEAGVLHVFSAVQDGELVGFISLLVPTLPHYGYCVGISESFFVAKAHRHTRAGLKLLSMAEAYSEVLGAPGLLVIAPYGGSLFEVLPRLGYRETNRVFFKKIEAHHDA